MTSTDTHNTRKIKRYQTPSQLADLLGISSETVRTLIKRGEITHAHRVGGKFLIDAVQEYPQFFEAID